MIKIARKVKGKIMPLPKKKFSIVTATYNCGRFLDDYFESIVNNDYPNKYIEIVLVDDGSTDNTAEVVAKWQKQTSVEIKYEVIANGGQANARNHGLKHATGDWVTFIDADDFISKNYFAEANYAILNKRGSVVVSMNMKMYYEKSEEIVDNHMLKYRFDYLDRSRIYSLWKDPKFFQLSMSSAFFEMKIIREHQLSVPNIRPQFEDAMFVFEYMLVQDAHQIIFVQEADYYYRRRADMSSTINQSGRNLEKYTTLLETAYLTLLAKYEERFEEIPRFIYETVLYDLNWNVKEFEENQVQLSAEDMAIRKANLQKIFSKIPFSALADARRFWGRHYEIGLNKMFYGNKYPAKALALEFYQTNERVIVRLLAPTTDWKVRADGRLKSIKNFDTRQIDMMMCGEVLFSELYVSLPKTDGNINFYYEGHEVTFEQTPNNFEVKKFQPDSTIIFFDRQEVAGDNAESLYNWFQANKPEYENIHFALNADSPDWDRLAAKGFNMLEYGSDEFEHVYRNADFILTSGLNGDITNYNNLRRVEFQSKAKVIFLQHGIIKDNIATWMKGKKFDWMVATAPFEYEDLIKNYTHTADQVRLTGLPRLDELYDDNQKEIIIHFTWRHEYETYNENQLMKTPYVQKIIAILTNEKLLAELKQYGYKIKLIPHPNMKLLVEGLRKMNLENEFVQIINTGEFTYREVFAKGSLLITDYSSVFFDFSYLNKPVLYIHDDKEQFSASHTYPLTFDYEQNGVGKVCYNINELLDSISENLENDCQLSTIYEQRINKIFKYRDKNNSQRVYEELLKM